MIYPKELLPNLSYKNIDCDLSNHYLIRLTTSNNKDELIDPVTGKVSIQQICSPPEHIDDLSSSLLGIYNSQHVDLQFTQLGKEKFMAYCKPDEIVETPVFETEFDREGKRHYWVAPISRLNNIAFPYTMGADPFTATCLVMHTPMKWNFWHFSLRWKIDIGSLEEIEPNKRKKIARRIGHSVRVLISHFASLVIPETSEITSNCYCKN